MYKRSPTTSLKVYIWQISIQSQISMPFAFAYYTPESGLGVPSTFCKNVKCIVLSQMDWCLTRFIRVINARSFNCLNQFPFNRYQQGSNRPLINTVVKDPSTGSEIEMEMERDKQREELSKEKCYWKRCRAFWHRLKLGLDHPSFASHR